jgi:hypothetical protein
VGGPVAGTLLLPVAAYPIAVWAGARAAIARAVLLPRDDELREVRRSRARLVDAYEAERRRIERDLHDGAQQRLVALTMKLGLAGLDLPAGSRAAREVADAHRLAKEALTELRELIRGVHPQVLTERGLPAAVRDTAGRSPIPVDLALELPGRFPSSVEVTAYFAVSEALANAAKHSGADRCRVSGRLRHGVLVMEVYDDGRGGADPARGTGGGFGRDMRTEHGKGPRASLRESDPDAHRAVPGPLQPTTEQADPRDETVLALHQAKVVKGVLIRGQLRDTRHRLSLRGPPPVTRGDGHPAAVSDPFDLAGVGCAPHGQAVPVSHHPHRSGHCPPVPAERREKYVPACRQSLNRAAR